MKSKTFKFTKRDFAGWLILIPGVILFTFFVWMPLIDSIKLSLYETKGVQLVKFVGFDNYIAAFEDLHFTEAIFNTFKYIAWSLVIGFFVPIILAIFISETQRGKGFFRTAVYFPNMVPGMAVAMLWSFVFKSGKTGVLNILLTEVGLIEEPISWLSDAAWVIPIIIIIMTWKGAGSTSLIYMAGISGIDPAYYEAAAIDGAGVIKRIFKITIPTIFSLGKTMLILQVISVFQILYEPLVLTNGGPNNASLSIMLLVYRYAFDKYDYSIASALSVIICLFLIVLSGVYMKLTKKKEV